MIFSKSSWAKVCVVTVALIMPSPFVAVAIADDVDHAHYIVRGNTHILVGVSLNEAAVRASLPPGIEPVESITGGYNLYRSEGGYNTPAYTRAYVWVDVEGYDSPDGAKARWVLWGVTGPDAEASRAEGYDFHDGSAALIEHGMRFVGTAEQNGSDILRIVIKRSEAGCSPAAGSLNYPVRLPASGEMAMHRYPFVGDICGATPVSLELQVSDDHPLAKFKPTALLWAALAKNMSFAGITTALE